MNCLSARQQEKYDNATWCYICLHEFVEAEAKGAKVRDHDLITNWFIGAPTASVTWSARIALRSKCNSTTSVATMRT